MSDKYLVTTAIDYANAVIHIGHVYQKVLADAVARYRRVLGKDVFFLTGTDEHGGKVETAAQEAGLSPKEFVDNISRQDKRQMKSLGISFDRFIRTTDTDHIRQVKDFYRRVKESGDIYKDEFSGAYCQGCEEYKTESDLVDGHCPYHPDQAIQHLSEENYFFRWSKYEDFLQDHITNHPRFVQPKSRRREMLAFLDDGLTDISISRRRSNVSWGIPVPDDPDQTIYVWFDALINYISGAPEGFWPADLHLLGKDNARWHALLWPAMLKSAGYSLPEQVYCHGFLSIAGQKISKSTGNIISPQELAEVFGREGGRYVLLSATSPARDGNISWEKMRRKYNDDLANGLGNLITRLAKLCQIKEVVYSNEVDDFATLRSREYKDNMAELAVDRVLRTIWDQVGQLDRFLNNKAPWDIDNQAKAQDVLIQAVDKITVIGRLLQPFLPQTAELIVNHFQGQICSLEPPFPRIEKKAI